MPRLATVGKAAALLKAIIKNRGFVDGNKRTAVTLADLLNKKSGYRLEPSTAEENLTLALVDLAASVASGDLKLDDIVDWFKERIVVACGLKYRTGVGGAACPGRRRGEGAPCATLRSLLADVVD